jgi:glycosyltransferase involved in cell wall biosynthesis
MKKITFLVLHLGYGGAEKAIASQANMLSERYEVEIISTYKLYDKTPFHFNKNVKIKYLLSEGFKPNKEEIKLAIRKKRISNLIKEGIKAIKILYLRKLTMKKAVRSCDADIIISSRLLYNKLLTRNCKKDAICIAQEHNHHNNNEKYINKIISSIKDMDYFMPVSMGLTSFYKKRIGETNTKCVYIPHCIDEIPENTSNLKGKNIISVGRLSSEKGFLDLIDVFKIVNDHNPEWILNIVGDGNQKKNIENRIKELHLDKKVILHGYQNKEYINKLLQKSSIYTMTSFEESFGIVLLEAQSFGIPCVAFDSAKGAWEIISHKGNGFLVKNRDKESMANYIQLLISDEKLRLKLGAKGRENSLKYSIEKVKEQWLSFVNSIRRT